MKNKHDATLHQMAASGVFRVTPEGRIETNRKWNGHTDVETPWYVCDRLDGRGYRYVSWHMVRVKAHRLAFLLHNPGENLTGFEVNHMDGDKLCNTENNLEKCGPARQSRHAFDVGLNTSRGEGHRLAKLTDSKVREMRALASLGVPYAALGRKFNVTARAARLACIKETWRHVT